MLVLAAIVWVRVLVEDVLCRYWEKVFLVLALLSVSITLLLDAAARSEGTFWTLDLFFLVDLLRYGIISTTLVGGIANNTPGRKPHG